MEAATRDSTKPLGTAEEESLKRNTDCVYFLASPLTCKKGSECEYRHSEAARMNPRDCWYWLNGNCLNAKCSFRHPPLDGLLGSSGAAGLSLLPSQSVASTQVPPIHTPTYNSGKQAAPCYFFQKGLCLKGDKCSFMHGPTQSIDKPLQQPPAPKVATSVSEPQTSKKSFGVIEKCTQLQNTQERIIKLVEVASPAKLTMKTETAMPKNVIAKRNILPPTKMDDGHPRYKPTNVVPVVSGNSVVRSHHSRQAQASDDRIFQNGKEVDEFLGESSPGFDVLVNNELRDSDYYKEDEYGRTTSHERRPMNPLNDFDYSRSADYVAKFDQEPYNDPCDYNPYGQMQEQYAWEQSGASFDRVSGRQPVVEKRGGFPRVESSDQIDVSDLRHRLLKQRRVSRSRSVISPNGHGDIHQRDDPDRHLQEQRNRGRSRKDSHHLPHESSISNRLRGRITLPGISSSDSNHNDLCSDRGRNENRLSPGMPQISSHQGRYQDRIKQWGQEEFTKEGQNIRGLLNRRGEVNNYTVNFSGPKRLAELKGAKTSDSSEKQQAKVQQVFPPRDQKNSMIGKFVGHQEFEDSLSFEGPKPLSVILKRKREAEATSSGNGTVSGSGDESSPMERRRSLMGSSKMTAVTGTQTIQSSESKKEANHQVLNSSKEESRSTTVAVRTFEEEEGLISTEGDDMAHAGEFSYPQKGSEPEREDGMMIDDEMEDQELGNFDHRDEEYDSEQVDGGDLKTEEDENVDPEEEYLDDEDGDDFAKRIGVLFS